MKDMAAEMRKLAKRQPSATGAKGLDTPNRHLEHKCGNFGNSMRAKIINCPFLKMTKVLPNCETKPSNVQELRIVSETKPAPEQREASTPRKLSNEKQAPKKIKTAAFDWTIIKLQQAQTLEIRCDIKKVVSQLPSAKSCDIKWNMKASRGRKRKAGDQ